MKAFSPELVIESFDPDFAYLRSFEEGDAERLISSLYATGPADRLSTFQQTIGASADVDPEDVKYHVAEGLHLMECQKGLHYQLASADTVLGTFSVERNDNSPLALHLGYLVAASAAELIVPAADTIVAEARRVWPEATKLYAAVGSRAEQSQQAMHDFGASKIDQGFYGPGGHGYYQYWSKDL